MKFLNHKALCAISVFAATNLNAALVSPQVDWADGTFGAEEKPYFTSSSDAFFGASEAYIFYGTFTDVGTITASSTSQNIEDAFHELGLSSGESNDVYSLGTTWKSDVNDTDFQGKRGYIIAANNSDIGSATEMAIVTNTDLGTWQFNNTIAGTDSPYAIKNGDLNSARGADVTFILGSYGAGGAGFETIQMAVTAVPEPSSAALLGLGALALTFRRKK
jgi:hypothetical protein